MADKPPVEPEPVSEFIRLLIERWESEKKLIKDLADQAGLAKSMPSQIKARTSNATLYSARKLAGPLGYKDLPGLVNAAWEWWHSSDRSKIPAPESPRADALRLAESYGVTKDQIERVLQRFPLPDYAHKDALWWLSRFHEERSLDAERAGEAKAEKHVEAHTSKVRKRQHSQMQELKRRKGQRRQSPKDPKRKAS